MFALNEPGLFHKHLGAYLALANMGRVAPLYHKRGTVYTDYPPLSVFKARMPAAVKALKEAGAIRLEKSALFEGYELVKVLDPDDLPVDFWEVTYERPKPQVPEPRGMRAVGHVTAGYLWRNLTTLRP